MEYLRKKFKKWLGIDKTEKEIERLKRLYSDLVHIGVDAHFKEPHMILIYSKLKGGQISHISANFDNIKELHACIRELKSKYHTKKEIWDDPRHLRKFGY